MATKKERKFKTYDIASVMTAYKEVFSAQTNASISQKNTEITSLENEISNLAQEIERLKNQITTYSANSRKLSNATAKQKILAEKVDKYTRLEKLSNRITELKKAIKHFESNLNNKDKLLEDIEKRSKARNAIILLSEGDRTKIQATIKNYQQLIDFCEEYVKLEKPTTKQTTKYNKHKDALNTYKTQVEEKTATLTADDEKQKEIKKLDEQITRLQDSIDNIEPKKAKFYNEVSKTKTEILQEAKNLDVEINLDLENIENSFNDALKKIDEKKKEFERFVKQKAKVDGDINSSPSIPSEEAIEKIKADKESFIEQKKTAEDNLTKTKQEKEQITAQTESVESFSEFLQANDTSTAHAAEIFKLITAKDKQDINHQFKDISLRKMHPTRDAILKKVLAPAVGTGAGIGCAIGMLAASNLISGSMFGFLPVMSNLAITNGLIIGAGAIGGAVAGTLYFVAKHYLTKLYYHLRYKSGAKNLEDLNNNVDIDKLQVSKLLEKIALTQKTILDIDANTDKSSNLSKLWNGLKKLPYSIVNRNRLHKVEAITKDLVKLLNYYAKDPKSDDTAKVKKLKNIYALLSKIEGSIHADLESSKLHTLLTCNEQGDHSHNMIENIDIYANLSIYLSQLAGKTKLDRKDKKQVKTKQQPIRKKARAIELLNGVRLIPQMLTYENMTTPTTRASNVTSRIINIETGTVTYTLENGNIVELPLSEISTSDITAVETTSTRRIIYRSDGSTTKTSFKQLKNPDEIYITAHTIKLKLEDSSFIVDLQAKNYATKTINNLRSILTKWLADNKDKTLTNIPVKGNAKTLYEECRSIVKSTLSSVDPATV